MRAIVYTLFFPQDTEQCLSGMQGVFSLTHIQNVCYNII